MSELREMLVEAAGKIFEDHADKARTGQAWPETLWSELEQAGFDHALVPEAEGGAGLTWSDAFALLSSAGAHAAPVPLAEAMIANWLLRRAGIGAKADGFCVVGAPVDAGSVRLDASGTLAGTLPRVPWGRYAKSVALVCQCAGRPRLALIGADAPGVTITEGLNLAKEPRDTWYFEGAQPATVVASPIDPLDLLAIAAIARSAQIAGAIGRVLELSVEYANLRVQFGRPIGKFQIIQQNLAVLATEAVAARAAADAGSAAIDAWTAGSGEPIGRTLAAASAKIRAGEAAGRAAGIAHQVFGAMGFTEEHSLHHYTKRLWSWRDEHGNEAWWARRLGARVVAAGPRGLWPLVTDSHPAEGVAHATA